MTELWSLAALSSLLCIGVRKFYKSLRQYPRKVR